MPATRSFTNESVMALTSNGRSGCLVEQHANVGNRFLVLDDPSVLAENDFIRAMDR
jgi:hypothetical protein